MFCEEFEASTLVLDNKDMEKLFKRSSSVVDKCFNDRFFIPSMACEDIDQIAVECEDAETWGT